MKPHLQWTREGSIDLVFLHEADSEAFPAAGRFVPYEFGMADREYLLREAIRTAEWNSHYATEHRVTAAYCDGTTCREVTVETALGIARSYVGRVLNEWQTEERMVSPNGRTVVTVKKQHLEMEEA